VDHDIQEFAVSLDNANSKDALIKGRTVLYTEKTSHSLSAIVDQKTLGVVRSKSVHSMWVKLHEFGRLQWARRSLLTFEQCSCLADRP